jgi:CheY-like chemotaxis protein
MALKPFAAQKSEPVDDTPRRPVLYVEDEDVNWELTERHLRRKFVLDRARNAKEAFRLLRSKTYEAVLMDIQLHGSDLNGIEIVRILRDRFDGPVPSYAAGVTVPKEIPIFFVTAYSARYGEDTLKSFGGDRLITKPVDFMKLNVALAKVSFAKVEERMSESAARQSDPTRSNM